MEAFAPLLVAVGALPALAIAGWYARIADAPRARAVALHWALIALAMFLGAAALYRAGDSDAARTAVVLAMALAVNLLAVSLVLRMRRDDRGP